MHIPDGFLDPKISASMMGAAAIALGVALARVKQAVALLEKNPALAAVANTGANLAAGGRRVLSSVGEKFLQKMASVAALVFAAQMFNFPIDNGTSGHLMGAVLAAVLLGPFAGMIAITIVLLVQMLFYADGGMLALGANIVNMGVIGAIGGYYLYVLLKKIMPEALAIFSAAWCSLFVASGICALQIGFSGTIRLGEVLPAMLKTHAVIGIAEGFITLALVEIYRFLERTEKGSAEN
jgi:cobalt/nickel transport system permease protein